MNTPDTPHSLLHALSEEDANDLQWTRFVNLYTPLIRAWLHLRQIPEDQLDDTVQEVLIALVRHLRARDYQRERAHFRTYLGVIVNSIACNHLRKLKRQNERFADIELEDLQDTAQVELSVQLDAQFRLAAYEAALQALSAASDLTDLQRAVLEGCLLGDESPTALATRLGFRPNSVIQTRKRLLQRLDLLVARWNA